MKDVKLKIKLVLFYVLFCLAILVITCAPGIIFASLASLWVLPVLVQHAPDRLLFSILFNPMIFFFLLFATFNWFWWSRQLVECLISDLDDRSRCIDRLEHRIKQGAQDSV